MDNVSREEKIRVRAYELWEKDGSLEGCADEYWEQARAQIEEEESAADAGAELTQRAGCPSEGSPTLRRSRAVDRPAEP
jgi:hypothetical protein